jgi:RNA-binding protein 5/10
MSEFRLTKIGHRIAFVEFYRASDATDFLESHPSTINLPLADSRGIHSEPIPVHIDFCRERDDYEATEHKQDESGWTCTECGGHNYPHRAACYRCHVERQGKPEASAPKIDLVDFLLCDR